jgi:hypothetical protein
LTEKANGQVPADAVVEEVQQYGRLHSKIASMAGLRHIQGSRAEVALLSLSRGYFANCVEHRGKWTAGVHLLWWTLGRLDETPALAATDIRGPISLSLEQTIALAKWMLIAFRLALVADVASVAREAGDPVGHLFELVEKAADAGSPAEPERLVAWLSARKPKWRAAFPKDRYVKLSEQLHRDTDT